MVGLVMSLQACSWYSPLKPVDSRFDLISGSVTEPVAIPGMTYVLFYNTANIFLYGPDNTGLINITVSGKGVGRLDRGEFFQLYIPNGSHDVTLVHQDLVLFTSRHSLELLGDPVYVEVHPTLTSNELKARSSLPAQIGFTKKFVPAR
jgi:hypothetical protein